jgi:putative membrane protein
MLDFLPTLNACLNAGSAIFLVSGRILIKHGRREAHRAAMIGAVSVSGLFLISYLTYHAVHGTTRFGAEGWIRPVYFFILSTHTLLAAAVLPMAIVTLNRGLRARYDRHAAIARWTFPVWLYVSVTGVLVYLLLYHLPAGL